MKKIFPDKYQPWWAVVAVLFTLILWGAIAGSSLWVLGIDLKLRQYLNMLIFAGVISLMVCLFGFFNGRIIFYSSILGVFLGVVGMYIIHITGGREESVTGTTILFLLAILGMIVGAVIQAIAHAIRKRKMGY